MSKPHNKIKEIIKRLVSQIKAKYTKAHAGPLGGRSRLGWRSKPQMESRKIRRMGEPKSRKIYDKKGTRDPSVAGHDWDRTAPGLRVSLSLGVAERLPGEDIKTWMDRADQAAYESKRKGRNRVSVAPQTST